MENYNRELTDQITNEFVAAIRENDVVSDIPKYDFDAVKSITESVELQTERVEVLLSDLKKEAGTLSTLRIQYYRPLTVFHKFFAIVIVFIKRLIRRCLRFLIEPIVNETEQYCKALEKTTRELVEIVKIQNAAIEELNAVISEKLTCRME